MDVSHVTQLISGIASLKPSSEPRHCPNETCSLGMDGLEQHGDLRHLPLRARNTGLRTSGIEQADSQPNQKETCPETVTPSPGPWKEAGTMEEPP